jgi:hypothetical protein
MMDPQLLATLAFGVGAALAVLVPYVLKVREDGVSFNMQYFYGLILSVLAASLVAMPAEVDVSFKGLAMIFMAGMGTQGAVNKGVSILQKRKQ